MKTIKKISAMLLIGVLSISNIFATGFPDEPMIIYGSVTGTQSQNLKIYNGNNLLIKEVNITSGKYGTNKTFNNTDKIKINTFSGELIFKIGDKIAQIEKGNTPNCQNSPTFQKGNICEYHLSFSTTIVNDPVITEVKADDFNIPDNIKTDNEADIFSGKIFAKKKANITKQSLKNLFKNISEDKEIILLSRDLKIQKNISKNLVLISSNEKQSLFISENTGINEEDIIIQKPQIITNTNSIKNKINKKIIGAIKIPTNKTVTFKKNIRICTDLITSNTNNLEIYCSQDDTNWYKDNSANGLEIIDTQVCFYTNHLTSFVIGEDENTTNNSSSSSSGGGGGYSKSKKKKQNLVTSTINDSGGENNTVIVSTQSVQEKSSNKSIKNTVSKKIKSSSDSQMIENFSGINYNFTDIKIDSKTYIQNIRAFKKNSESILNVSGYKVIQLKGNTTYNKQIDLQTIQIFDHIKLKAIRESMFSHMNKMNTIYGILSKNNLDEATRDIYSKQLKIAQNNFKFKLKKLQFKDMVIRKALEKRRVQNEK